MSRLLPATSRSLFGFLLAAQALLAVPAAAAPASAPALAALRPEHPRLYVHKADWARIKALLTPQTDARRCYDALERRAEAMLNEPTARYLGKDPNGSLEESRDALDRIATLAGLYRLDGDPRKLARARAEIAAAVAFPDWVPAHYLTTAEMVHALAIGYDWLYEELSPDERLAITTAIADKGLTPGLAAYRNSAFWTRLPPSQFNWQHVTNAGLVLGALTVSEQRPELAAAAFDVGRWRLADAIAQFGPDGGWEEGPGYWRYGMEYTVYALAAMETALGASPATAFPALGRAGAFRLYNTGPTGRAFNFADASEDASNRVPGMFWLANTYKQQAYATDEWPNAMERPSIFHLLWARPGAPAHLAALDARFRRVEVATFRSAWGDPQATFVGFKGGSNLVNHGHLDLGSFVLDAAGQRWASDLGPESYGVPGYFSIQRFGYYRTSSVGHNVLTIDGENQFGNAVAPLIAYRSTPSLAYAIADLSQCYPGKATRALRGVALVDRRRVLVQDEIEAPRPVELTWHFHTQAAVALSGREAMLSQGGSRMVARILSPSGATFSLKPVALSAPETPAADMQDLSIVLPRQAGTVRLAVEIAPVGTTPPTSLQPLSRWDNPAVKL